MELMLAFIVNDKPLSQAAEELNNRGFLMRNGMKWTQTAVFNMLPRLIEVAPQILSTEDWSANKHQLLHSK